jgi:hypothetical protein
MDEKKRGRPPGPKKEVVINSTVTTEPKKRGRKAKPQTDEDISIEMPLEGEIEGTTPEKLKSLAKQLKYMDWLLDKEPYRFDIRLKKNETIQRMCFLIEEI